VTKRPIQILILALIQLFNPVVNTIINSMYYHLSFWHIVKAGWMMQSWDSRFTFFFLGPITAIAIYSVKKWSLPLAIACVGYVMYQNIDSYLMYKSSSLLALVVTLNLFQTALIVYLLLPRVRTIYTDAKVRWWESLPRYIVNLACTIGSSEMSFPAETTNLSQGGAFLITRGALKTKDVITFTPDWLPSATPIQARVVYGSSTGKNQGFGVEFLHTPETKHEIKTYVAHLRKTKTPTRIEPRHILTELKSLLKDLTRGEGWLPQPVARRTIFSVTKNTSEKKAA
jgi:hypothetical protein